jgi:hypothetical protein
MGSKELAKLVEFGTTLSLDSLLNATDTDFARI